MVGIDRNAVGCFWIIHTERIRPVLWISSLKGTDRLRRTHRSESITGADDGCCVSEACGGSTGANYSTNARPTLATWHRGRPNDWSLLGATPGECDTCQYGRDETGTGHLCWLWRHARLLLFTGRQYTVVCYAEPCISYARVVRLSVCLSHVGTTPKRRKLGSRNLHQRIAAEGHVLVMKSSYRNSKGFPRPKSLNESRAGKIHNFQPINRCISETVKDRTKVTIND